VEQRDLIEPMKLNPLQLNERAQRLCDALTQRDLIVADDKRARAATKDEVENLDKVISRLRAEIRESRPSGYTATFTNIEDGPVHDGPAGGEDAG
jgi:hypothetical protein